MAHILITGGSGLIGKRLVRTLRQQGHAVATLSRTPVQAAIPMYEWDISSSYINPKAFEHTDTIIHLAGAGIADKRWTDERKKEILDSRVDSTKLLYTYLKKYPTVRTCISASAIGYYGFSDLPQALRENDPPGNDFLADVVTKWEAEVDKIESLDIRVVKVRIGIVLSDEGGALPAIAKPVRLYAGAPLGSGNQWVSWIHIDDLVSIFAKAVEDSHMKGAYNAVAPNPVTNRQLTKAIASALEKPLFLPAVPAAAMHLILGEMADMVLKGNKVSAEKILSAGYQFKFDSAADAVKDLLKKH